MSSISPAMISTKALGAMPAFAASELGNRKAAQLLSDAGLRDRHLTKKQGYISEHALCEFVANVSRALGEANLGLLFAPLLTVADYGAWGDYVLSAPDLRTALMRAQREMKLHSNTDRVEFLILGNTVSYSYRFGLRSHRGYPDIAFSAVASMLSIPRYFLGQSWSPAKIEFDFSCRQNPMLAEETFGCPISFNGSRLRLLFDASILETPNVADQSARPTVRSDILRERSMPPKSLLDSINTVVGSHVADGDASLERLAQTLDIGPRKIQRHMAMHGIGFRELLTMTRMERAVELLQMKGSSVSKVSESLGYGEPGNFTRAFTQHFGKAPTRYLDSLRRN